MAGEVGAAEVKVFWFFSSEKNTLSAFQPLPDWAKKVPVLYEIQTRPRFKNSTPSKPSPKFPYRPRFTTTACTSP
jgi:hypothetical protein